jgi:hypothetical protein
MHTLLLVTYQLMVPMMIAWFMVARRRRASGSIVVAYVTEMIVGPILYAIVPACGPVYAFHGQWLNPPVVQAVLVRLSGMPNAFPSLHTSTALVFVSYARGKLWQAISFAFLAATMLATLATGEHYVIDLAAGLGFGCFAANVGRQSVTRSVGFLSLVVAWSLCIRFGQGFLIAHALMLQLFVALTVGAAIADVIYEWNVDARVTRPVNEPSFQPST